MCRYIRRNKRVDPKIYVDIRKEKAAINKGKVTNQVCGRADKNLYSFLLVNKLTWWWFESHFDIFVFLFVFALYMYCNMFAVLNC